MEEVKIGKISFPLKLQKNDRLKKSRLSVDKNGITVEAPSAFSNERIATFVEQQKEWIFNQWNEQQYKRQINVWPERFVSGAKIYFSGRMNQLEVRSGPDNRVRFEATGFVLEAPTNLTFDQAKRMFINFFEHYLAQLIGELIVANPKLLENSAPKLRFMQRRDRWAYCDENHILHIGWDLAFFPKKVIEYVLLHELCHLRHRNHGETFWQHLRTVLPDFIERREALHECEKQIEF